MSDVSDFASSGATTPASDAAEIAPADVDLAKTSRSIYVGGSGDLKVMMAGTSAEVTFIGVIGGTLLPIRAKQIMAATTATNIIALS